MQTVSSRKRPTEFQILGAHAMSGETLDVESTYFDAFDCLVWLEDRSRVVLGVRTATYVKSRSAVRADEMWGDYQPLPITLDLSTVRFWDFDKTLWIGPEPLSCLVYSNAQGISALGIEFLLSPPRDCSLLHGPEGAGLPSPEALGIVVPDTARRFHLRPN